MEKRFREAGGAKSVEVAVKRALETTPAAAAQWNGIEVRLKAGRSVVVEPGFSAGRLRALLAVLENQA